MTSSGTCSVTCNVNNTSILDFVNLLAMDEIITYRSYDPSNYININDMITLKLNNISSDIGYVNFQIELQKRPPKITYPNISVCGSDNLYQNNFTNI
jgi:hypothetical protein